MFPQEVGIVTTKVSVVGGLLVDGSLELELSDDHSGAEIKVVLHNLQEIGIGPSALNGTIGVHKDGERVRYTDSVSDLNQDAVGKLLSDQGLGDPSGSVGSGSVYLGGILSGEGTTTVGSPTAIGIDDDLTTSQTGITLGTTNDETARGVQMVDGLVIQILGGDGGANDVFVEITTDGLVIYVGVVLNGDHNGVNPQGDDGSALVLVFNGDLGLGIRTYPVKDTVLSAVGQSLAELGGQDVGQGHHFLSFVGGIAEHETLITSTNVLVFLAFMHTLGNIGALLFNGYEDVAGLVIETNGGISETDSPHSGTNDILVVHLGLGGDLSENHHHSGLACRFTSNLGVGIFSQAGIQNGVRDLIAELIRVTLRDALGSEQES